MDDFEEMKDKDAFCIFAIVAGFWCFIALIYWLIWG